MIDGGKASGDHSLLKPAAIEGNYGVYATADDRLAILDVDDYGDIEDKSGLTALMHLPATFEQGSPHGGTHRIYAVEPDDGRFIADVFDDEFGKENLKPSWGEVRVANQYVVGAGSQLDGCDKDWCDECATEDGGQYVVKADREIATIEAEELVAAIRADPTYAPGDDDDDVGSSLDKDADVAEILDYALNESKDEKLQRLWRGDYSDYGGDRSEAESAVAYKLAFWLQGDKRAVRNAMNGHGLPDVVTSPRLEKWNERDDDSYRDSVLEAVNEQTEHFEPSKQVRDPSEIDYSEVDRGDAILDAQTTTTDPAGQLRHKNGCYGYLEESRDDDGIERTFNTITNFTLETVSYLDTYEGQLLTIQINPKSPVEDSYEVQVHPTVFNESRSFKEEIVRGRTTRYEPGKYSQTALNDLRQTVGSQPAPSHAGREHIGLHGDDLEEWVTPDGTLTSDGWSDDPAHVYYEKGGELDNDDDSSLAEKWDIDPEDGAEYDHDTVVTILEKLPQTRRPSRGLPVLGWFYAAALKPAIHEQEGEFPLLQVTGGTVTGKTSTIEMLYEAFGAESSPFGCGDKGFTIEKKLAGSCGFPIWLDEYKPTDLASGKLNWLHRRLREVTREKSVPKGTPSLGEVTFKMRAPVVFSGEQTVTEAAVRSRTVTSKFTSASTEGDYKKAFCELTGASYQDEDGVDCYPAGEDLTQHALAYFRYILSLGVETITEMWHDAREQTTTILRELDIGGVDNREFRGLQTVTFGVDVFRQFARTMGVEEDTMPGRDELKQALEHVATNIGPDGQRREHIDDFTELLTQAATAEYVEDGVHYRIVNSQKWGGDVLAFHMPTTFSAVKRYIRDYNLQDDYSILGKNDYLDNFGDKAAEDGTYALDVNRRVRDLDNGKRAVYLDPSIAADHLGDGFNIGAFGIESDEKESDSSGLAFDASPIEEAAVSLTGYVCVTAEIMTTRRIGEEDQGVTAVLQDDSGVIDAVGWDGAADELEEAEGRCIALKNAKVSEHDGNRQLTVVDDVTELEEIQQGVGNTAIPDSDSQQLDEFKDEFESGDDEIVDPRPQIVMFVREQQDADGVHEDSIVEEFSARMNEDKVVAVIGELCRKGRLVSPQEHYYRA